MIRFLFICVATFSSLFSDVYVDSFGNSYTYCEKTPFRFISRVCSHDGFINVYLDNGTVWRASGFFSKKEALTWKINDACVIYQNTNMAHKESFYIYNSDTTGSCYVDISCSAKLDDQTYLTFKALDYNDNIMTMQNGHGLLFYYQVSYNDIDIISTWNSCDCIVLGSNQNLLTEQASSFPYILINTNTNQYVRAEHMQY